MWSRTSTFQFLIVVVVGEVFKIYALDRFQQRLVEQISSKTRFHVFEVFKVSSRDTAPSAHSPGAADEALTGFFRTFPKLKKLGSELAADSSPLRSRRTSLSQ